LEQAALDLHSRLDLFAKACDLRLYRLPRSAWNDLLNAYGADRQADFDAAASKMIQDAHYANQPLIKREVIYNTLHPFRLTWVGYLAAVAAMIGALLVKNRWIYRAGLAIFLAAVALHVGAFAVRCSITGWAPVTNIYETVIWVALTGAIFSLAMEAVYRRRVIAIAGASVAAVATVVADAMPPEYGSAIRNLAPVLRSNYWLTIHVLTIVSSYAAFALAMVLGNIVLGQYLLDGLCHSERSEESSSSGTPRRAGFLAALGMTQAQIRQNIGFIYRSLQIGVLLIAAGTILGGLWADVSWGRFWGWDPKEVWALIVLLTYLALLHARFAGWVGPFGLALCSVLGFSTVVMSWYGVNFLLGVGLHSYGFASGGQTYVAAYLLFQLIYVAAVWLIHRKRNKLRPDRESSMNQYSKARRHAGTK
jgi:cytochrome c-type biogenesis protein CcsB